MVKQIIAIFIILVIIAILFGVNYKITEIKKEQQKITETKEEQQTEESAELQTNGKEQQTKESVELQTKESKEHSFEVDYPKGFVVASDVGSWFKDIFPGIIRRIDPDKQEYLLDGTEQNVYIIFERDNTDSFVCQQTQNCDKYTDFNCDILTGIGLSETKNSNNIIWYRNVFGDRDMQASYERIQYGTYYDGMCYKITFLSIKSSIPWKVSIEGETDQKAKERIDKIERARELSDEKILKSFNQMLSAFKFI